MAKSRQNFMDKYSDEELIAGFFDSFLDGDPDDIKASFLSIIQRFGATRISRESGIPRSTLYDLCKDESNPTLDNICLFINFVNNVKSVS